jgi:hypothetical protein
MYLRSIIKFFASLAVLALFAACSSVSPNYLREELANEGPVALSKDNPFIAANMFLSLEQDASPLIKKFISYRGEPDAVEIRHEWFGPMRIFFFYMDNREGYVFEERDVAWVIRGPEKMPFSVLDRLGGVLPGKPALAERDAGVAPDSDISIDSYLNQPESIEKPETHSNKKPYNKSQDTTAKSPAREQALAKAASPSSRPKLDSPKNASKKLSSLENKNNTPEIRKPSRIKIKSSRDIPRASSKASATSGSDISHVVNFPGETLRIISSWYTGNPDNAGRIARINGIENPDVLYLGQEIRLPEYLLKRRNSFPEEEVERYIRQLSKTP